MKKLNELTKKRSIIKYLALIIGTACLFLTFVTPTRVVMIGSIYGDYMVLALSAMGVILSIISLKKELRKFLPILSLILSLSYPILVALWLILFFLG
ncbi:hypothetical protein ACE1TH_15930 [Shouchella sp. JSM 1781072]|uniref:hypothetical protein n=1 Tax=Shouchella sp. JSM 1781072 TaxID=3344581 RepID=UPI0035C06167